MSKTTVRRVAASRPSSTASKDQIAEELRRYDEHLRDVRGLSDGTRSDRLRIIGRLLRQRFAARPLDFARLLPVQVRRFLARQLGAHPSRSNASVHATALRSYLRYRTTCGDAVGALSAVISAPVHWRLASLPRALKPDELELLLNAFTPDCHWPKRGYAILRCAVDMGLRCDEIAKLMISDIDWRSGTVTLRSTKSLRQDILPLPVQTGHALADYLQHERPLSSNPAIFLRRQGACDQPITSMAIQKIIKRAGRRVGLTHFSAHAPVTPRQCTCYRPASTSA